MENHMSEAWDKVQEAAKALKEALDIAAKASAEKASAVAHDTTDLTKHVLDTAHRNIDSAVDWVKRQVP
jgi:hypothetical protein